MLLNSDDIPCQYVTDEHGEKKAVILDIGTYHQLLEDIQDLAAIAERREEPSLSHAEVISDLKANGLLPS